MTETPATPAAGPVKQSKLKMAVDYGPIIAFGATFFVVPLLGIAPRADLVRDFPAVADTMLEATRHSDPNQGVFSRLMDSASSAIRVRPVGSVEGEGPEAVVARIEDKLTNGDLKGASLEWDTLPEPAKTAGAEFKTKLDQRIRVEGLIDATVAGAMTANQG